MKFNFQMFGNPSDVVATANFCDSVFLVGVGKHIRLKIVRNPDHE